MGVPDYFCGRGGLVRLRRASRDVGIRIKGKAEKIFVER